MPYDGLTRISVCVLDEGGLLQVRGGEGQYPGVLPRVPSSLSIGDTAHVRVSVATDSGGEETTVDLLGTVFLLEGGPGPVTLKDGLIFEVDVSHMSRRAVADAAELARSPDARDEHRAVRVQDDDAAPRPAPVEMAATAEAMDATDDDTLHASPLAPHPVKEAPSLDDQEAVDDEEPLESPIHFRSLDVERRQAEPEVEAELLETVGVVDAAADASEADDDIDYAASLEALRARQDAPKAALDDPRDDDVEAAAAELLDEDDRDADGGFGEEEVTAHERSGTRKSARSVFDATEPSGVVGTLREMALTEVVQSLEFAGKTAEIDVRPKGSDVPPGVLFLERGHVIYARCGTLEGEDAFFRMADQRRGAFLIRFHTKAPTRNIDQPTAYLLLEALRRTDEEAHERDLVERVAEEEAAKEAEDVRADDADQIDDVGDRTMLSPADDPVLTEPFARLPAPPTDATRFDRPPALASRATRKDRPAEVDYELGDEDVEEALVDVVAVEQPAYAAEARPKRPYATATPTTIFSRFFEEASAEESKRPLVSAAEADDVSDPTFSGLKAALKGLKRSDEDTLAAFDKPVSSGSFPSYS